MKSTTRLDSAVFQLTPTRTRCDLYIIANGKKEKIASGLLNPFIAHLKAAQDQIAQGGYSVLLAPQPGSNATWFTKSTVQSFVRFVSTPDIVERVYTIESEILQIEEAIAIQGNTDISIKDQYVKPMASNEGNKPADEEEEKAIVLYKPGAHELPSPSTKERNSKVQLINVLETRKTVLKKEQGMAFARAVAAGFEIENVANLLSFAECFGASRLMSGCLRFMDLWKQKHESGQWVEIEAEDAMSECTAASAIVLSSMTNETSNKVRGSDSNSETASSNTNTAGGEQGGQHPGLPPWGMHSPQGGVPVYQPYPMPYYQHYHGFYPPPPYPSSSSSPIEDPSHFQKRQSIDNNRYTNTESESVNGEESPKHRKSAGKKKSGRVVIRNINFINSTSSESASSSDTDTGDHTQHKKRNLRSPKRKGNRKDSKSETLNGKETDSGHWDAFQTYLLKSAAEDDREDMFAMEKDPKAKRRQKTMGDDDPLLAHAKHNGDGEGRHMQSYDASGRKIVYRSANDDDFIMVGRREEVNVRGGNGFEEVNLEKSNGMQHDEAVMVSLRATSGVNDDYNITKGLKLFDLPVNKSNNKPPDVKYEPDALSLMPERDVENTGYDPAIDYEMQLLAVSHDKKSKQDKKGSKSVAEKHQLTKPNQGMVRKGRPSKVNTNTNNNNRSTLEDARARADKLRSYKAELQKMKKEQQDAEQKRLDALKMERQKRISARTTNSGKKPLPSPSSSSSKLSPISHMRGSTKFTDLEPGSSSPLQRSKIRHSISNLKKPLNSKLTDRNHSAAGNRMTRSLSSMSDTKKESTSVTTPSKASSITRIRRLSEPKKINSTPHSINTKTKSAESVSKPKSSTETKKISEAIGPSKAAESKITVSSNLISQKVKVKPSVATTSEVAKLNLNNRLNYANDNPVIDKTVVMLEDNKQQPSSITSKEFNSDDRTAVANIHEVPMETVDKGTISVHPQKHPTTSSEAGVEEVGKKYEAPYARVSSFEDQSTRNSEYAKAVPPHHHQAFGGNGTAAYVGNLKMEKIPEKPQSKGGFRRLIKLGKKTPSVQPPPPPPPPQVDTLKSLISADEHAQKSSRRLFSFPFRGEKKATSSGS